MIRLFAKEMIKIGTKEIFKEGDGREEWIFETIRLLAPFLLSLFHLPFNPSRFHHSSLVYPLDLALAKFRLATGRRAWRRRDFNWKRVAHTHAHDAHGFAARRTFTKAGDAGEEGTRRATRRRLVSINSVSLLTTRRG